MLDVLLDYMRKFVDLPESDLMAIAEKVPVEIYEKGTLLQDQGAPVEKCYFVLKGLVRQFHYDEDGNEITSNFFMEEQSVVIFSGKNGLDLDRQGRCPGTPAYSATPVLLDQVLASTAPVQCDGCRCYDGPPARQQDSFRLDGL